MADFGYSYEDSDVELYSTNLYGGSDADLDNSAPVDDTDGFTSDIDLTTWVEATLDFKFDANGATDDLVLTVYKRRDSSWDYDEIAKIAITVPNDGSEDIFNLDLSPALGYTAGHYRIAMQSAGGTDTFDIDVQMRRTRYQDI